MEPLYLSNVSTDGFEPKYSSIQENIFLLMLQKIPILE